MIKHRLIEDLKKSIKDLGFPSTDIVCTISKNPAFGDYSTNLALQLAKLNLPKGKQYAPEIAKQIGNAVPPGLAARVADVVYMLLTMNDR